MNRGIRKLEFLVMGMVVLALAVSCPGANSGQAEAGDGSGLNPADAASTTDTTPTFGWNAVPNAEGYEWRIADSQSGLNTAAPVAVTGTSHTPTTALTTGQTYYWQVRAKYGAEQFGTWSAVTSIQIDYPVGGTGPAGGIVFYDKGSYSDGWRYLEAALSDQISGIGWGGSQLEDETGTAIGSGKSNTEKIVTELGKGNYAAWFCYDHEHGGYDDWFLPSKDELNELYKQKDTVGRFASYNYWSSSDSSTTAWLQSFTTGNQFFDDKDYVGFVRAVRAF